jgi:Fe-S-cluster formation regulator IscX/YfhJ
MMTKSDLQSFDRADPVEVVFLQLKDIQMELSTFSREALAGATHIITECRKLIP